MTPPGRAFLRGVTAAALLITQAGCTTGDAQPVEGEVADQSAATASALRQQGVAWTAGPDSINIGDFEQLASLGVNWIAQTPFGWQSEANVPELRMSRGRRVWWGERDTGITVTTQAAREAGIATLLKPHVWLSDRDDGVWRGQIAMTSEEDWARWFQHYTDFIVHYAELAEALEIEALCIGTELHGTVHREAQWRELIARVRKVYSGRLTYAANWYEEYEDVPFWDALDWIGVQAYFPLSGEEFPTSDQLETGWTRWMDEMGDFQARMNRPVLFTEVGYRSVPYVGKEPWTWPTRGERTEDQRAFEAQASAYDALFRAAAARPWLEGIYLWKWYPSTGRARNRSADFTPQGKPAERVMERWFNSEATWK